MTSLRDIKRGARREVHDQMSFPALYLVQGQEPMPIRVRLLMSKPIALGNLSGSRLHYAQTEEVVPRMLFLCEDFPNGTPLRNAVVSVQPGEAYTIRTIFPPDDITITVAVTRLDAADAAGLPTP